MTTRHELAPTLSRMVDEPRLEKGTCWVYHGKVIFVCDGQTSFEVCPASGIALWELCSYLRAGGHSRPLEARSEYLLPHLACSAPIPPPAAALHLRTGGWNRS